jgi:hypothetical protein
VLVLAACDGLVCRAMAAALFAASFAGVYDANMVARDAVANINKQ